VRAKIQALHQQVADKDGQLEALQQRVEAAQQQHATVLRAVEINHKARTV
jgi:hypothetical protein